MIQRIQSIFLLLAGASFFGLFGLPMAKSSVSMDGIFSDQVYNLFDNPFLIGLCVMGGLLAIINIFLFKNRPLQKKISMVVVTMAILFIITAFLLVLQDNSSDVLGDINEGMGLGLPVLAIIFTFFANRYIKKDDKLVKSMDRLR